MCLLRLQLITAFRRVLMRRKKGWRPRKRDEGRGEERWFEREINFSPQRTDMTEEHGESGRWAATDRPTEHMWAYLLPSLHLWSLLMTLKGHVTDAFAQLNSESRAQSWVQWRKASVDAWHPHTSHAPKALLACQPKMALCRAF